MSKVPTFSTAERDRRWNLARDFMKQEDVDALIVFGEHEDSGGAPYNIDNWFTNDRPGQTVIFKMSGEPITLVPMPSFFFEHMEGPARGEELWIRPENLRMGRDASSLVNTLAEQGLTKSSIGVLGLEPGGPWHPGGVMPFTTWSEVIRQLPNNTFKAVGSTFVTLVLTQSDEEIAVLRQAASIGEDMVNAMVKAARPGGGESEVVKAAIDAALERGTAVPMMHLNSGPKAVTWGPPRWTYRAQAPRTLQNGDLIASELFCNFGPRSTQLQCTIAIGEVHKDVERAGEVARASYLAGLKKLQPGAKFGDVADAMLAPVQEAGGYNKGPQVHTLNPIHAVCGFAVDLSQQGIAKDGYPNVLNYGTTQRDMVIQPGMSFAFEPSCGFGPHVVCLGGSVIVTKDGPVELNPSFAQLLRAP